MKNSVKAFWVTALPIFAIVFSFCIIFSDGWYETKTLVQEAVYSYVRSNPIKIIGCWIATVAVSVISGGLVGAIPYLMAREKERDC